MKIMKEKLFLSREYSPDLFRSSEAGGQVFLPIRLAETDVKRYRDISKCMERLIYQMVEEPQPVGKIQLVVGDSGSGKTYLIRRARTFLHEFDLGFFAYMQLTTTSQRYDRYILQKMVDSFDQPMLPPRISTTTLQYISNNLADRLPAELVAALKDAVYTPNFGEEYRVLVDNLVDRLINRLEFRRASSDVLRAFMYLQCPIPSVQSKVRKYFRLESLSAHERSTLGGIMMPPADEDALWMVEQIAHIVHEAFGRSLVIAFDQLEDIAHREDAEAALRRVFDRIRQLSEMPKVLVLLTLHKRNYENIVTRLEASIVHRIRYDPTEIALPDKLTRPEAALILRQRLNTLFEAHSVEENRLRSPPKNSEGSAPIESIMNDSDIEEAITPIPLSVFEGLNRDTVRDLLKEAAGYRTACWAEEAMVTAWPLADKAPAISKPISDQRVTEATLSQLWNEESTNDRYAVPESPEARVELLSLILTHIGAELRTPNLCAVESSGASLAFKVILQDTREPETDLLVVAVESTTRGGHLLRELEAAQHLAHTAQARPVLVRSTEFLTTKNRSKTSDLLAKMMVGGGRKAVIQDADWRKMVAFDAFRKLYGREPNFEDYLNTQRPMTSLPSVRAILELDELEANLSAQKKKPPHLNQITPTVSEDQSTVRLLLGQTIGRKPQPVEIDPECFKRHVAMIGGTGSGKTSAAQQLLEQLLERGTPVIMVDRKGDLSGYRMASVWEEPGSSFKQQLKDKLDVAVYTPGRPDGATLNLPLVSENSSELSEVERHQAARTATHGLSTMLKYGQSAQAQGKAAILQKALEYSANQPEPVSAHDLLDFLKSPNSDFIVDLGGLAKYLEKLTLDLEAQLVHKQLLLDSDSYPLLSVPELLGKNGPRQRSRLSIICTKFMTEPDEQFWMSQMLTELNKWTARSPSDHLQAVLFIDEADKYIPATKEPATKAPLGDLLRRARSSGLGIMLGSQNPGDFDYRARDNISTWFIGKLTQERSFEKVKELIQHKSIDLAHLSRQKIGEFVLRSDETHSIKMNRCEVTLPEQLGEDTILHLAREGLCSVRDL